MVTKYNYPIKHVFSGSYVISKKAKQILLAPLGTCTGVAICDREAEVGGLHHILLPEPITESETYDRGVYASTGLPLFIEALCEAGAGKERMEATVAGGALVGQLGNLDLELDIGGRTSEVVLNLLQKNGIRVIKSETGGFFSCNLQLNLDSWESEILPIGVISGPVPDAVDKLSSDQIDQMIARVRPIPQIALKVLRMIGYEEYAMKDLAEEVRKDQVLSAKVLTLCNSIHISPRTLIESIDHALFLLGEKTILQMIVSATMDHVFLDSEKGYSLCKGGLFHHAFGTAIIAESLARFTGRSSSGVAYTSGLLHDIGKVVLDQHVALAQPLFYRRIYEGHANLVDVEGDVLGTTHTEVGRRLAKLWALSENLQDTIAYHHHPEKAEIAPELVHLVYLADLLMSRFKAGVELERIDTTGLDQRLKVIGLALSRLPEAIDSIPWGMLGKILPYEVLPAKAGV